MLLPVAIKYCDTFIEVDVSNQICIRKTESCDGEETKDFIEEEVKRNWPPWGDQKWPSGYPLTLLRANQLLSLAPDQT